MRSVIQIMCAAVLVAVLGSAVSAAEIETVFVGHRGNLGRIVGWVGSTYLCGSVGYDYRMGKHEVTARQYVDFLNAVAKTDAHGLYNPRMVSEYHGCQITRNGSSGSYTYDFSGRHSGEESDWENRPVNYVGWGDAARFANWMHNGREVGVQDSTTTEDGSYRLDGATEALDLADVTRADDATWVLPSEDEWFKAAYHKNDGPTGNYFSYPTSNDQMPGDYVLHPERANRANYRVALGRPYYRNEVGFFFASPSPYGTFDQGGNLAEWSELVPDALNRGMHGGSYASGPGSLIARNGASYPATGEISGLGFRLAHVPEPASMAVLALGAMAMIRRRRSLGA
jgi:formylglycine-generating enzyme